METGVRINTIADLGRGFNTIKENEHYELFSLVPVGYLFNSIEN